MVKATKLFWSTLLVLAIALSGCSDDDGGGGDGETTTTTTTGTMTGNTTDTGTTEPGTPTNGPQYVNGTVSGALDCTLISQGQGPTGGASGDIPLGYQNGTYTVSVTDDQLGVASVCIYFDGDAGTGTVPANATTFRIYADQAPAGVGYSVEFLPPA